MLHLVSGSCELLYSGRGAMPLAAAATRRPRSRCRVGADLGGHAVSKGVQRFAADWRRCNTLCKAVCCRELTSEHGALRGSMHF